MRLRKGLFVLSEWAAVNNFVGMIVTSSLLSHYVWKFLMVSVINVVIRRGNFFGFYASLKILLMVNMDKDIGAFFVATLSDGCFAALMA